MGDDIGWLRELHEDLWPSKEKRERFKQPQDPESYDY